LTQQVSVKSVELSPPDLAVWRGFLRVHAAIVRELDAELQAAHGLPLSSYEVLLSLAAAPERRLRMIELADALIVSQSGVTRLVDRLERGGLVRRERCATDARGLYAVLTDAGLAALGEARPTHLAGVHRLFLDRLEAGDCESLAATWERLQPGVAW
jgi:DNA-binding MarR family transcriptional regulator